jgi:hypothetical protein
VTEAFSNRITPRSLQHKGRGDERPGD